jgi:hypothetical protein
MGVILSETCLFHLHITGYLALTFVLDGYDLFAFRDEVSDGDVTDAVFNSASFKSFTTKESVYDGSPNETFFYASTATCGVIATEWAAHVIRPRYATYRPLSEIEIGSEDRQRKIFIPVRDQLLKLTVKSGCFWDNSPGCFRFQQIRPSQAWDGMVFVSIYPEKIRMFWARRDDILNDPQVVGQHTGMNAKETLWLSVVDDKFPSYFRTMDRINTLWE